MPLQNMTYKIGDFVFCKWKGSPPWPARIKQIKDVKGKNQYKVIFYGTFDFGFFYEDKLYPYSIETKNRLLEKKSLPKKLRVGVEQMEEDIANKEKSQKKEIEVIEITI